MRSENSTVFRVRTNGLLHDELSVPFICNVFLFFFGLFFFCLQPSVGLGQQVELQRFEFTRPLMGVEFKIVLYAESETVAADAAEEAFAEIQLFDASLSDYKSGSEIRRLCGSAPHAKPVPISERLWRTIQHSETMHQKTNGAFDITIGPLSRVWRTARKRNRLPTDVKVNDALARMGMQHIRLVERKSGDESDVESNQETRKFLQLDLANMQLDFGGIAKGLAADSALKVLSDAGVNSALIDASGDVVVSDAPPGEEAWSVEIPSTDESTATISLVNGAVATSGDVYQFLEVDGVRYSHLVDPKTGRAITTPRIVTVIGRDGMTCDSYASAISVLGQEGLSDIEFEGLSIQIIEGSNRKLTQFSLFRTPKFPSIQSSSDDQGPQK